VVNGVVKGDQATEEGTGAGEKTAATEATEEVTGDQGRTLGGGERTHNAWQTSVVMIPADLAKMMKLVDHEEMLLLRLLPGLHPSRSVKARRA
jgi:hypothetical protein